MSKRAKRAIWILAGLLLAAVVSAYALRQLSPASTGLPTTRVQKGTLRLDIHTTANLHTPHSAMVVAPSVSGTLQIIHLATTGTPVRTGDVVVEFDPSEQEFNLEQSRSQLAEADQQITKAKADSAVKLEEDKVALLKARFEVRRAELDVSRNELVSEIDGKKNLLKLEEAKRHLAQLEQDASSRTASDAASIALLEEKRRSAQLGMQQAQHNIDSMQIKATIDGLVSIKDNLDAGGGMQFPGMQVPEYREGDLVYPGRTLAEVMDTGQMEAVAKVFENDRPNITPGQTAELKIDAQPEVAVPARVKTIAGMAARNDFGSETVRTFDVTFELLKHPEEARPGTSAAVVVNGTEAKDQLYLPSQCIFDKDGKLVVYIKHGNEFEARDVQIKFRTENRVAVENLSEGTEVALVNPEKIANREQSSSSPQMGVGK
jgi:HlyD family secretion protein